MALHVDRTGLRRPARGFQNNAGQEYEDGDVH